MAPNSEIPFTMRAITQTTYGTPDVLLPTERPVPAPADNEVLVRVKAAGIDASNWHLISGKPYLARPFGLGLRAPKRPIPGLAFAGQVAAAGSAVGQFRVGDNVMGAAPGAFAEYLTTPEAKIRWMPQGLDYAHAAAIPISAVTALEAVRDANIEAGDGVLVLGAGGGVGHYAVQLATAAGGRVTGVSSGSKSDFVRSLGAEEALDYRTVEPTNLDRTWDVIIDTAGSRPLSRLRHVLAEKGTLVIVGGEAGGPILGGTQRLLFAAIANIFTRQRLHGLISTEDPVDYEALEALLEEDAFTPRIDRTFGLAEAADAINYVRGGAARGKVVLTV
jgi:NADPH:quinone reductase-like Zn-dependent oxidoreductase